VAAVPRTRIFAASRLGEGHSLTPSSDEARCRNGQQVCWVPGAASGTRPAVSHRPREHRASFKLDGSARFIADGPHRARGARRCSEATATAAVAARGIEQTEASYDEHMSRRLGTAACGALADRAHRIPGGRSAFGFTRFCDR
jgi:hypothetical protein